MFYLLLDPVGLFGEGQYNLHSLKEIIVTESFIGLNQKTRNCQNDETYSDCKTRHYIKNMRQQCGCLPLSLRLSEKVNRIDFSLKISIDVQQQDALCMTDKEIFCSQTITTPNSTSCIRFSSYCNI